MSDLTSYPLRALTLACIAVITGCAVQQPRVPAALDFPRTGDTRSTGDFGDPRASGPTETVVRQSPIAPAPITGNLRPISAKATPDERAGDLSVNFEQMALPVFIQAVYGGILKVNYSIDPAVTTRTELITFRTPKPLTAAKLSEVSAQLLRSYGVAVQDFGGVLRMVPDSNTNSTLPLVRRGRAQPSVPLPLRPIFHYVETEAVRPGNFLPTLKSILGSKVTLEVDSAGGMLLSGQPDDVSVALELIQVFDHLACARKTPPA
jgi:general secretion pathway protein D